MQKEKSGMYLDSLLLCKKKNSIRSEVTELLEGRIGMCQTTSETFSVVCKDLVNHGLLLMSADGLQLLRAKLSPNDRPIIRKYIPAIGQLLYEKLRRSAVVYDAVVSIPSGGDEYASALAYQLHNAEGLAVPRLVIRRDGQKYPCAVEKSTQVRRSARLLIVDDVLYSGKSAQTTTRLVESKHYCVAGYLCVAELGFHTSRNLSAPILSVFNSHVLGISAAQSLRY